MNTYPPDMPPFIESFLVVAVCTIAAILASLLLDTLRAWSISRPNKRRKTHGTRITRNDFGNNPTQHLDP